MTRNEYTPRLEGDLDAGQHQIYNLPAPVSDSEAANKAYVDAGGGGGAQTLAEVVAAGNAAEGSIVVDGDNSEYLQGAGDPAAEGGGAASVVLGSQSGNNGGTLSLAAGAAQANGATPGNAELAGGDGWSATGSRIVAAAAIDPDPGRANIRSGGSFGASGQALVSDGSSNIVYGGVRVAAAVPVTAPAGNLPFAYDTTAVTGGFYFWNGAAWVKIATIL